MKGGRRLRARILAVVVALMGLLNVTSSVFPGATERLRLLHQILPPAITLGSRSVTLVAGFFLMAIAWNLAQRKQVAWLLTNWLLLLSAFSHLFKGLDIEEATAALLLLALSWWWRRDFTVRSDPVAVQGVFFALPYVVAFLSLYSVLGFFALRRQFQPGFDLSQAVADSLRLATFQGEQFHRPLTRQARWFLESITWMSGLGLAYLSFNLMRPVLRTTPLTPRDRDWARQIVSEHGSSGIAYFALGQDKSYFFNPESSCVISYVLVAGVALAAGDPIGAPEDLEPTVRAFANLCEQNDWAPAFYQVQATTLPQYREAGFETLKIGEEALVDIPSFDTKGKVKDDLRAAVHRATREGWQFLFFDRPIHDEALVAQLSSLSEAWLADKFGGEMGFTMGGTPISGSQDTLVTAVVDANGEVLAFMTWVPMYRARGWAGDFMRRATHAPGGAIEYLIVQTIERLRQSDFLLLSLGLAPLANLESENQDAVLSLEKALDLIYERFNSAYHYKSLHDFKVKFGPRWESRYLAYPGLGTLPKVMYALVNAQMPRFGLNDIAKLVRR